MAGIVVEKCDKLWMQFSKKTTRISLRKYDNAVEITLLFLYLFLGIVGKYIVILLEITVYVKNVL